MMKKISKQRIRNIITALLPYQSFKEEELKQLTGKVKRAPAGMIFISGPYGVYFGVEERDERPKRRSYGPFLVDGKNHYACELRNYSKFKKYMDGLWWNKDGVHTLSEKEYRKLGTEDFSHAVEWQYQRAFRDNRREVLTETRLWYESPEFEISIKESEQSVVRTMEVYGLKRSVSDPYTLIYDEEEIERRQRQEELWELLAPELILI